MIYVELLSLVGIELGFQSTLMMYRFSCRAVATLRGYRMRLNDTKCSRGPRLNLTSLLACSYVSVREWPFQRAVVGLMDPPHSWIVVQIVKGWFEVQPKVKFRPGIDFKGG